MHRYKVKESYVSTQYVPSLLTLWINHPLLRSKDRKNLDLGVALHMTISAARRGKSMKEFLSDNVFHENR